MYQINLLLTRKTEWERTPSVMAKRVWYECGKKLRYLMKSCINFVNRQVKILIEEWTLHSIYCNIFYVVRLIFKLLVEESFALCTLYRTCLPYFRYGPKIAQVGPTTLIHSLRSLSCDRSVSSSTTSSADFDLTLSVSNSIIFSLC
jgi:hypothetical protein